VKDVKPSANGEAQEVKVKVRINHNGLLLVASAQMVEKKEVQDAEQNGANEGEAMQTNAQPSPTEPAPQEGQQNNEAMDTTPVDVSCVFSLLTKLLVTYIKK